MQVVCSTESNDDECRAFGAEDRDVIPGHMIKDKAKECFSNTSNAVSISTNVYTTIMRLYYPPIHPASLSPKRE